MHDYNRNLMSTRPVPNTAIICLSPYYGGMEMDAFQMAKMLSEHTNVTLIVKNNFPIEIKHKKEAQESGIKVEPINFYKNLSLSLILKTRKIITKYRIKNVIYFGASELKSLYFSFIGIDVNLVIRHGTTKSSSKKDFLHRLIYSKVNYHVAISAHLAENVKQIIPFGKNTQLKLIYSSLRTIPTNISSTKNHISYPISLLHVARITAGKGQVDAIKACEVLYNMKKEFVLHLVGDIDPNYQQEFIAYLETVPYKDSIKLEGFSYNVSQFYKTSDIFIFPSKGEGLGNSFIEALSYGLTCISYENTIFPEIKNLGFYFFLAENLSIPSLKNTLETTLKYIDNNSTPITKNIILAKELFSKEKELKDFIEILM